MIRRKLLVLLLVLVMALTAFGAASAQDDFPLRVGLMVDQSGGLTIYGYELEYGFKLGLLYQAGIDPSEYESIDAALEDVEIGGRQVEILIRDNASDPDTAASQARELIEVEGVEVLVGAPSSGVTVGLQQVALDNEVILFAAPGASPTITGEAFNLNTFRVCRNSFQDSAALGALSEFVGPNWMILAADYEFGRASAGAFEATLPGFGVNFIQETLYGPLETTDFTPYLQEVAAAAPDALLTVWAGDNSLALYQQIEEQLGDTDTAIIGGTNSNDISAVALLPEQVGQFSFIVYHYDLPDNEINDWLVEKHIEFFPNPVTGETDYPDLFTGCAFATAQAMTIALEETAGDTLPSAMIPVLEGMIFDSPKGTIGIRPSDHQALVPMYLIEIANTDDPEFKFYELLNEISAIDAAPPCLLVEDFADRCGNEDTAAFMEAFAEATGGMMDGDMDMEEEATDPDATEEAGE